MRRRIEPQRHRDTEKTKSRDKEERRQEGRDEVESYFFTHLYSLCLCVSVVQSSSDTGRFCMIIASVGQELMEEFSDFPDSGEVVRIVVRIFAAIVLGGMLGYEREHEHKPAGIRTHMLVSLGAA